LFIKKTSKKHAKKIKPYLICFQEVIFSAHPGTSNSLNFVQKIGF